MDKPPASIGSERQIRWIEVLVVLVVAVGSNLYSIVASSIEPMDHRGFWLDAVGLAWQSLQVATVVAFIIWRSPEGWKGFGLPHFKFTRDIGIGFAVLVSGFIGSSVAMGIIAGLYYALRKNPYVDPVQYGLTEAHGWQLVVLLLVLLANSFAEEVALRAFLITRFEQLFGSARLAVAVSALLFASYHSYQGVFGFFGALAMALIYGKFFIRWRSVWMLVFAHTVSNLWAFAQTS
ncbi:MAG: CPBP family intramembrane glutamic endopeptidase [Fimbriimonas sp.]